ncbi:MAG: hypothetical protein J6U31_00865 [Bacteroidales bacterium]|nr:hypothetical protein [Bacteroidales bacterium]
MKLIINKSGLWIAFMCTAILLFCSCNNRDAASKTRMIKDTTSSNEEFSFDSVVVSQMFQGIYPELHFILTKDSISVYFDSIEVSSSLPSHLKFNTVAQFDLLQTYFTRETPIRKQYRKPIDDYWDCYNYNMIFYNNEKVMLDTAIMLDIKYEYLTPEMLLWFKNLNDIQNYLIHTVYHWGKWTKLKEMYLEQDSLGQKRLDKKH